MFSPATCRSLRNRHHRSNRQSLPRRISSFRGRHGLFGRHEMTMDRIGQLCPIVSRIAMTADFDGFWKNPVRDIVRMDLLSSVLFHRGVGLSMRFRRDEITDRHRTEPILLAYGAGVCGLLGADDIINWSVLHTALVSYEPLSCQLWCSRSECICMGDACTTMHQPICNRDKARRVPQRGAERADRTQLCL